METVKLHDHELEEFYGGHIPVVEEVSPEESAWFEKDNQEEYNRPVMSAAHTDKKKPGRPKKARVEN